MVSAQMTSVSVVFHINSDQVVTLFRRRRYRGRRQSHRPGDRSDEPDDHGSRALWSPYQDTSHTKKTAATAPAQATRSTLLQWRRL
jgi:hypothetical protein